MVFKEFRGVTQTDILQKLDRYSHWWMNFPEIGPAHVPEIEISKKYWMSFPKIGLCHAPGNWTSRAIFGWAFQDLPIKVNYFAWTWMNHWIWKSVDSLDRKKALLLHFNFFRDSLVEIEIYRSQTLHARQWSIENGRKLWILIYITWDSLLYSKSSTIQLI